MGSRILTHNLGYPPMGALREPKKSLEAYWIKSLRHVLGDLRGLSPRARAIRIIENCAHPPLPGCATSLSPGSADGAYPPRPAALLRHLNYLEHGAVLPDLNVAQFGPHHVPAADKA